MVNGKIREEVHRLLIERLGQGIVPLSVKAYGKPAHPIVSNNFLPLLMDGEHPGCPGPPHAGRG